MDGATHEIHETLVLTGGEIAALMGPADHREAVEAAFAALADGRGEAPAPMQIAVDGGAFHVKGAGFPAGALGASGRAYAAFKVNGNFPGNPARHGRPTIQGAIVLCDGQDGRVLALMDSIEITLKRTAAASAVAARRLARPEAARIAVLGCGAQALAQLEALADVLPLRTGWAWDQDAGRARALADAAAACGVALAPTEDLAEATGAADVIVTCTTARRAFLGPEHVAPGTFVAAVGADTPGKSELVPGLLAGATVVVDLLAQALVMGDLRHAVAAGAMRPEHVHAELGDLVTGRKRGRTGEAEVTIFDSTGVGAQDVASAARAYELAIAGGLGRRVALGAAG